MTPEREAEIWRLAKYESTKYLCARLNRLVGHGWITLAEARELQSKLRALLDGCFHLEEWICKNYHAPEIEQWLDGDTRLLDGQTKDWIINEEYNARRRWLDHLIAEAKRRAA